MGDVFDNVSRETNARLIAYEALLKKWNSKINLVSPQSLQDLRVRHIEDSLQIVNLAPNDMNWLDLGSGGGLPGLIVACTNPNRAVTLVESDNRKGAFLRTVARELDLTINVISERIEDVEPLDTQILSARALAPLNMLLEFAERHRSKSGICLFPKGMSYETELTDAKKNWKLEYETFESKTDSRSVILKIRGFERVG